MRRAFSVVELLVVLAIISILAALLLPVLARAKSSAKITTCQSNLKQVSASMALYASDNEDAIPVEAHPYMADQIAHNPPLYGDPYDSALKAAPRWPSAALRYGAVRDQFHCPLDVGEAVGPGLGSAFSRFGTSYLNDTLGGLVFKTFSAIPDSGSRTLVFDRLGGNHGSAPGSDPFRTLVSCTAYDGHVRTALDNACANATTEPASP